MKKLIVFLFLVTFLNGCAKKEIENKIEDVDSIRRAPDIAMQKCEEIKPLEDGSFKTIVLKLKEVSNMYNICEEKRQSLQDFIEKK